MGMCSDYFNVLPANEDPGLAFSLAYVRDSCSPGAKYTAKRFQRTINVGDKRTAEIFTVQRPDSHQPLKWHRSVSYLQRAYR